MIKTTIIDSFYQSRLMAYKWRQSLTITNKILLALLGAVVTGLCAQAKIMLPWTPVPLTGQTFAVVLSSVLLGGTWGGISQIIYIGLGIIGVPWFTGFESGFAYFAGPTGGYLIGFILASFFLGHIADKYIRSRGFVSMLVLMSFANYILIYVPGMIWLAVFFNLMGGKSFSLIQIFVMGALPFFAGDAIKIVIAALAAKGLTPKQSFGSEADVEKAKTWRLP